MYIIIYIQKRHKIVLIRNNNLHKAIYLYPLTTIYIKAILPFMYPPKKSGLRTVTWHRSTYIQKRHRIVLIRNNNLQKGNLPIPLNNYLHKGNLPFMYPSKKSGLRTGTWYIIIYTNTWC